MNPKLKARLSWMTALFAVALLTFASPKAAAQDDDPPSRVARLNYIQGNVSFQPAGEPDWVEAIPNRPVTTGDRLWTDRGSRAELHTGAATIRLDSGTGFSFLNLDDRTVQIELTEGSLSIRVQRLDRDEIFEVDTPNQAFSILRPGQYRIQASADGNSTFVMVRRGEGEATGGGEIYTLRSGQSGRFTGTDYLSANIYNAGNNDDFDNWGEGRDRHDDRSQSARYVSADVVGYEDLDDYGSWRADPSYGNVWVPTRVSSDWAPYREGHWAWISPWGWTWVDDAPWGYAPFHYGRWVTVGGSWGWVPGPREVRPVYAPALVVFIGGPQFGRERQGGNVGWFPLGPREVYVPGYKTSRGYVDRVNVSNTTVNVTTVNNVYNSHVTNNTTNITYVNKTERGGVTAVPQGAFTGGQPVAKAAVAVNAQQIASAPVTSRAEVAPTKVSVLGTPGPAVNKVAQPPAATVNRPVVAKTTPPPPPVPFVKQQQALAAHPGEPLAKHEVEILRPAANAEAARPMVKQAPPGKPGTPNTTPPVAAQPGQPGGAQPANQPANNKPATVPAANAPPSSPQPTRADRPGTAQQSNPPADGRPPADNAGRPVSGQSPNAPVNTQGNPQRDTQGNKPQPMPADHPGNAQQNNPPVNTQPQKAPVNTQGNPQRDTQSNKPQPMPNDRPAAAQPGNPPSGNRSGADNAGRPVTNQPPAFRDNRPSTPANGNNPPEPSNRRAQPAEPPAQSTQPVDRRPVPPPQQPAKAEPAPTPKTQPSPPPLTQAEKDKQQQQEEKKRQDKPPPQ
jgi:hypothetical protein